MNPEGRPSSSMPVRNLLALWMAAVLGFFLGLLEALDRMPYGQTIHIAEVGLIIALLTTALAGIREQGRIGERLLVSLLRIGLAGGVFVFVFEGMRLLLKVGIVGGAVASWVWAGVLALLLARLLPPARVPIGGSQQPREKAAAQSTPPPPENTALGVITGVTPPAGAREARASPAADFRTEPASAITMSPTELARSAGDRGCGSHQHHWPGESHANSFVESP